MTAASIGLVVAYVARYSAGALLLIAAAGKLLALRGQARARTVAVPLLVASEGVVGLGLLMPIGGVPVVAGAVAFLVSPRFRSSGGAFDQPHRAHATGASPLTRGSVSRRQRSSWHCAGRSF